MITGIYRVESLCKSEKAYIGSSINIKRRWREHLRELRSNKHDNQRLQHHFNKYGEPDLVFIIVELCFPEFLTAREQYYIDKEKPYFNICRTAGSCLGLKRSEEAKEKMKGHVPWNKGTKQGPISSAHRQLLSLVHKGVPKSEEHKRKLSQGNKGKHGVVMAEEIKQKISASLKGRPSPNKGNKWSEETRRKMDSRIPWNRGKAGTYSTSKKGQPLSEEAKQNLSKIMKAKWKNGKYKKVA